MAGNPVLGFLQVHYSGVLFPEFPSIAAPNWEHWKIPFVWQQVSKLFAMTLLWPDWWLDDPRSALVMEVEQRAKIIPSPVAMAKLTNTTKTLQKPEIFSKMALEIVHATAGPCSQYHPPPPKLDGWNWRELAQLECSKYQAWPNLWSIPNPYLPVSFQPSPQSLDTNLGEAATHGTWLYVLAQKGCILYLFQRVQHVYMIMQRYAKYVQMMGMSMRFAGEPGNRTVFINRCSLSVILCKSVKLGISSALRNQKPIACSFSFPRFF